MGDFGALFSIIPTIAEIIFSVPPRLGSLISNLKDSIENIADGFILEIENGPKGVINLAEDSFTLIQYIQKYITDYIGCLSTYISNIRFCFIFYIIHTIGIVLYTLLIYLPMSILCFIYKLINSIIGNTESFSPNTETEKKKDNNDDNNDGENTLNGIESQFSSIDWSKFTIYQWETYLWQVMDVLDLICITYIGFHIIHYPLTVRETCYTCIRLKDSVIMNKTAEYIDDIYDPIFGQITGGIQLIITGIMKIFMSLLGG